VSASPDPSEHGTITLVFLPGMMCDGRLFAPQIAHLGETRPHVVADLSGPATVDGMAERVLKQVPQGRLALCGLSMGGIVAMAILARAPERVAGLALLDTNHRADAPERRPVRERQIADASAGRHVEIVCEEMMLGYFVGSRPELETYVRAMAETLGADAFVAQSQALMSRPDRATLLRTFAGPTLVLCGTDDQICPPTLHDEMAGLLPRARRVDVKEAAHLTTLEQPEAVSEALDDWLNKL
jgi:pimeloyl-ACP methyl ester carboxylesterase